MSMSPHTIPVALVAGATQVLSAKPTRYKGIVVRELSAGACVLRLWDNASAASGTLIEIISLASGETKTIHLGGDGGIACANGLFLERVSGTDFEGSVRLG